MPTRSASICRGALLGAATGILSQSALATVLNRTPEASLPGPLRHEWVRRLSLVAAGGEVAANAFVTSLPPRTDLAALSGRVFNAGLSAWLVSRRDGPGSVPTVLASGGVAVVAAWSATTARAKLARHVPDPAIAGLETLIAFGLARSATSEVE